MSRYSEVEVGAFMHPAENGFIVEVVEVEETDVDPQDLVDVGEPAGMGEYRASNMPKTKTAVSKLWVYLTLQGALDKLEDYFSGKGKRRDADPH